MDVYILDLLVIGLLLLAVTLGSGLIARLPLSYALIYLTVGGLLGPYGTHLIQLRPDAQFLERLTEFVVLVSLFSCGLKMNRPLQPWRWNSTIRLIGLLMPISIVAVAAAGHWLLGLGWGAAVLMGAILAPTDPVLASEVQLSDAEDPDELRFGLTSEGGLNDALAFPFVYFGLHWLQDSNLDNWFRQWVAVDLIWAIAAGLGMGIIVAQVIVWIRRKFQTVGHIDELMEDFIALSTILIAYSVTEVIHGYGFLAVFVAGVTVRRSCLHAEQCISQLEFVERIEKLMEVGTILLLGSLLRIEPMMRFSGDALIIAGLLLFLVRPLGAWVSTWRSGFHLSTRFLFGWFGIRGVGSLYYLTYAFGEGLGGEVGEQIAWITYLTVVLSVIIHGISSTPLMKLYDRQASARRLKKPPCFEA